MDKFDYNKALEELEKIAELVENPSTSLDSVDKYIRRSDELIGKCREYLRSSREKLGSL
ncbi:MAG: exodeoxyribonuclease VII small subunit [Bacteroidales bacterium]|nr:exodeoxyribonuclease VII small subunit [Bacteroidales bacterium]